VRHDVQAHGWDAVSLVEPPVFGGRQDRRPYTGRQIVRLSEPRWHTVMSFGQHRGTSPVGQQVSVPSAPPPQNLCPVGHTHNPPAQINVSGQHLLLHLRGCGHGAAQAPPGMEAITMPTRAAPKSRSARRRDRLPSVRLRARSSKGCPTPASRPLQGGLSRAPHRLPAASCRPLLPARRRVSSDHPRSRG
jgi:hypothetical protein